MDNTVEMIAAQMQDDAAVTVQNETPAQTLADVIGDAPAEQPAQVQEKPSEPGWIKQRVGAAVNKAVAEAEARIRAEYEAQLAPLREAQLEREADALVAEGKISDKEMAMDYLRSKQGLPAPVTPSTPAPQRQRDDQGRFVSATKPTAEIQQRAAELVAQADTIYASTGVDVMNLYNTDPEIRQKILSGEWTFVDVFKNTKIETAPVRQAPAPIRSANGLGMGGADFRKMTSEQFAKVNELLESGGKIDVR